MTAKASQQAAPATDSDRAATLQLIIALGRTLQVIERAVRSHLTENGLSLTEFAVLEVLYHKGALRLGAIRDRILVTGASTTYVVKKLEERGLMRRRVCAEDSRVVFGELTAKGRALIDDVFRPRGTAAGDGGAVSTTKARGQPTLARSEPACPPHDRGTHYRGRLRPSARKIFHL